MDFRELHRLIDYDIPIIEILNKEGELVFRYDLRYMDLHDIDIVELKDDKAWPRHYGVLILKEKNDK